MRTTFTIILLGLLIPGASLAQNNTLDDKVNSFIRRAIPIVNVDKVRTWSNAKILDARKEHEFEVSHLPNAHYLGECPHHIDELGFLSKSDTIIVYCTVGYRSENLGELLKEQGYTNVYNLFGGIFAWKNAGGTVVDMNNKPTEKVHTHTAVWAEFLQSGEAVN